jgi:peptide/nickel transport system substrate-binding protein
LAVAALMLAGGAEARSLVIGTKYELNTLDPHFFSSFPTQNSHSQIFNRLVELDPKLAMEPGLATSWRAVDETTWEFKLREGVRFHDGSTFSADDVIATFGRVPNVPNSPNSFAQYIGSVKRLEKVDDLTLRMITAAPNPTLPHDLASIFVISKKHANATTAEFNEGKAAVGTGPYKLASWTTSDRLVLERFDGFWGAKEPWEKVTERVIANDASRVAALLSGEVDVINLVPAQDLPRIRSNANFATFSGPAAIIQYIALDSARDQSPFVAAKEGQPPLAKNPLKDARVRKALSLALNRNAIVERLMEKTAEPASQLLPSSFEGTSQKLQPDPHDAERAKKLLGEAGYPNGFKITLHATNDRYANDAKVAEAIGQMWTRIGLAVSIEVMPGSIFFTRASKQEFSAFMGQYGTTEAAQPLRALIATWNREKGLGTANRTRYSDPEFDNLLQQAVVMMDLKRRSAMLAEAAEMAMARQAVIPIFYPTYEFASKKDIAVTVRADPRANGMMMRPR